tara:strand:- start:1441 stop:1644 length:204 start_codon:yes stop_codon:yes gene_type:complete
MANPLHGSNSNDAFVDALIDMLQNGEVSIASGSGKMGNADGVPTKALKVVVAGTIYYIPLFAATTIE